MQNVPNTAWRPTRPETQHIQLSVSITLASITLQYCYNLMLNVINWQAHSGIYWFFSWALCKYCALVCTPKSISVFTKYSHWTIFWTIWITSAPTRFVFKRFFYVILPSIYLASYKLKLLMHLWYLFHYTLYSKPFESSPRPFFLSLQDLFPFRPTMYDWFSQLYLSNYYCKCHFSAVFTTYSYLPFSCLLFC